MEQGITSLEGWGYYKISGEEPPFEIHYSQEQFRRQSSLITQAEFLFLIQIQVLKYTSKAPFI